MKEFVCKFTENAREYILDVLGYEGFEEMVDSRGVLKDPDSPDACLSYLVVTDPNIECRATEIRNYWRATKTTWVVDVDKYVLEKEKLEPLILIAKELMAPEKILGEYEPTETFCEADEDISGSIDYHGKADIEFERILNSSRNSVPSSEVVN